MPVYKQWKKFCEKLKNIEIPSKALGELTLVEQKGDFFALKHDVENKVKKAYKLCKIESDAGIKGTFYVQHYLLEKKKNVALLKKMQSLGAEICYHHDVMDSTRGDYQKALDEFREKFGDFEKLAFNLVTVCQHGNPVVERVGYHSNRDFFRKESTVMLFPETLDVMVNYKAKVGEYVYISDAGRKWKIIFDPENNDILPSEDKDVSLDGLDEVIKVIEKERRVIVSTHPHRWNRNAFTSALSSFKFRAIKATAKILLKIPFMKKLMSRFYYLAKKV